MGRGAQPGGAAKRQIYVALASQLSGRPKD